MEGLLRNAIFEAYGVYNVMGYEESGQRGYLTFTCGSGTFVAVLAKQAEEVWFYKFERRMGINE